MRDKINICYHVTRPLYPSCLNKKNFEMLRGPPNAIVIVESRPCCVA